MSIDNAACSLAHALLTFVMFLKICFSCIIIFQEILWNNITIWTAGCININERYESFSLVLHAQDSKDSRIILIQLQ